MASYGLIRASRQLHNGKHLFFGNYRDFSLWEFAAPPRLQHLIEPVEKKIGVRSSKAPDCGSVFMHMKDPLAHLNGDLPSIPLVTADDITPDGKYMRGSGLHGPERTDITRLVLYNRLKARQLQRLVPSDHEAEEDHKLVWCSLWFTISSTIALHYMYKYGMDYSTIHEHYPWTPPRTDGTRGPGHMYWLFY
ncbi:hypothetical protein BaOVIS_008480 [Babesia ovis]|uniref:Uncharacterized protein n=1 Tax=Babesia ovis TaxID=5869 RepID=A0A9W5WU37_BABOV|nr:hypothetical protein BaOVIS_008480 [Babesia ovis]